VVTAEASSVPTNRASSDHGRKAPGGANWCRHSNVATGGIVGSPKLAP
jgi:hypothetical protein